MRIIVFFDLPVKTKKERRNATQFRNFLIKDGFYMMQYSVYARVCNGNDMVELHKQRLKMNVPDEGSIRVLVITEKQYENVEILLGKKSIYERPTEYETLSLFWKREKMILFRYLRNVLRKKKASNALILLAFLWEYYIISKYNREL